MDDDLLNMVNQMNQVPQNRVPDASAFDADGDDDCELDSDIDGNDADNPMSAMKGQLGGAGGLQSGRLQNLNQEEGKNQDPFGAQNDPLGGQF